MAHAEASLSGFVRRSRIGGFPYASSMVGVHGKPTKASKQPVLASGARRKG